MWPRSISSPVALDVLFHGPAGGLPFVQVPVYLCPRPSPSLRYKERLFCLLRLDAPGLFESRLEPRYAFHHSYTRTDSQRNPLQHRQPPFNLQAIEPSRFSYYPDTSGAPQDGQFLRGSPPVLSVQIELPVLRRAQQSERHRPS